MFSFKKTIKKVNICILLQNFYYICASEITSITEKYFLETQLSENSPAFDVASLVVFLLFKITSNEKKRILHFFTRNLSKRKQ